MKDHFSTRTCRRAEAAEPFQHEFGTYSTISDSLKPPLAARLKLTASLMMRLFKHAYFVCFFHICLTLEDPLGERGDWRSVVAGCKVL